MTDGFIEGSVDAEGRAVAHRSKPPQHSEEYKRMLKACAPEVGGHQVRIHRSKWPPPQPQNPADRPHVAGVCQRCECRVIVQHPVPYGITVVLYGDKGEAQGQVVEEGEVIEEADVPVTGQVLEEHETDQRRRGRR